MIIVNDGYLINGNIGENGIIAFAINLSCLVAAEITLNQ
jgi:hypothetical protein